MALEKELETYRQKLPELKDQEGRFVLIHDQQVDGTYTSYEDAITEGYAKFGLAIPFLVKRIQAVEQSLFISRFVKVNPCHTLASK